MSQAIEDIVLSSQDEADFQAAFPYHKPQIEEDEDLFLVENSLEWYDTIAQNTVLVKEADKIIKDRMIEDADSISIKDVIAIKSEAQKQINIEKWAVEDHTWPKIIPAVINIQVINN